MKCEIVKVENLSGKKASVYSVYMFEDDKTLFERFIELNFSSFKSEVSNLVSRIRTMGHKTGIQDHFFKPDEGKPGDEIWAFYDVPNSKLRLYVIYFNRHLIILGGGGPKKVRALQDDNRLKSENYILRSLSREINKRIRDKDIIYINDGQDFEGNLIFDNISEEE